MLEKISIYSTAWCEIIFEEKNKKYGAFLLRKGSGERHLKALLIAIGFVALTLCAPLIMKSIKPDNKEPNEGVSVLSALVADKKEAKKEIKIDEPMPVKIKNTIKFIAPIIDIDNKVNDNDFKTQDELNRTNSAISIIDHIGITDINAVDPADLVHPQIDAVDNKKPDEKVYQFVEQEPEFNADQPLKAFLAANIIYPKLAIETGIKGVVEVQFVVEPNGSVSNIVVERGIGGGCDEEAIRVVKAMPKWKPGKQNGIPVRVRLKIPIKFNLM